MKHTPANFLGLSDNECRYNDARVAILPIPYEATVSYGGGTAKAPDAIIEASTQVELYDQELDAEPFRVGVATRDPVDLQGLKPEQLGEAITAAIKELLDDGKWPLILGGEHSITPPTVKAVGEKFKDLTVVQLDAHADLRQEYEGDPMSHACAMARVFEICPAVQVGIRSLSVEEAHLIKERSYPIFYAHEIYQNKSWMLDAIHSIDTENVYLTLDIDVFDSSILPATGTPEPGGMRWYDVIGFLRLLFEHKRVVGMDLVELAPIEGLHAHDFLAARLAYKCIGFWALSKRLV